MTIEDSLLQRVNEYANKKKTTISGLVEDYFVAITRSKKNKSIIDVVEGLTAPPYTNEVNLKEEYYKDVETKYGA